MIALVEPQQHCEILVVDGAPGVATGGQRPGPGQLVERPERHASPGAVDPDIAHKRPAQHPAHPDGCHHHDRQRYHNHADLQPGSACPQPLRK